jgi:hypothetical protein
LLKIEKIVSALSAIEREVLSRMPYQQTVILLERMEKALEEDMYSQNTQID